jgi:hypothetical protein
MMLVEMLILKWASPSGDTCYILYKTTSTSHWQIPLYPGGYQGNYNNLNINHWLCMLVSTGGLGSH